MSQVELWVIVPLVVVGIAYGLSRLTEKKDDTFARKALDALYAGTCSDISEDVWDPAALDIGISTASQRVKFQYGEATGVKFQRTKRGKFGAREEHWLVTAEKEPFRMVLSFDDKGKLIAIAAQNIK